MKLYRASACALANKNSDFLAIAKALVARNLPINFSLKGHKTFKYHLWVEGAIMKSYRAPARALANKNSDFLAIAKALVARNFAWALPKQKGTIK